jgi:hypothetical protein
MRFRCSDYRKLARLWLLPFLLLLVGCGVIRISGAINPTNATVVAGTVSFVQFTAIFDSTGTLINVTVVTLAVPQATNTLTFCGNQASQFTMNSAVQISFTPTTQACSNLISVAPH